MSDLIIGEVKVDGEKVWNNTVDILEDNQKARLDHAFLESNPIMRDNADAKKKSDGFTQGRNMRHVARIDADVYKQAEKIYGPNFSNNKVLLKKFLTSQEGQPWARVPTTSV